MKQQYLYLNNHFYIQMIVFLQQSLYKEDFNNTGLKDFFFSWINIFERLKEKFD
jgi:hypothetical protein